MHLAELVVSSALFVALGLAVLGASRPVDFGTLLLGLTTGIAVAVPVLFVLMWAGLPASAATILGTLIAIGLAALGLGRLKEGAQAPSALPSERPGWSSAPAFTLLGASLTLFVIKVATMPLWSWDHYAIWGVKLRRLVASGPIDLEALALPEMLRSRPDYPLGLQTLWQTSLLGSEASALDFKALHVLCALVLAGLLYGALREIGQGRAGAALLTSAGAASPLFWDTVSVGLAEMPLALFSVAAVYGLLAGRRSKGGGLLLGAGLATGFLPWIKDEGVPLALLLVGAGLWVLRRAESTIPFSRRAAPFVLPILAALGLRSAVGAFLPDAASVFHGPAFERAVHRLPDAPELLGAIARHLAGGEFLGIWIAFGLALVACLRRSGVGRTLGLVVGLQLSIYAATMFLTYLPPEAQIDAAIPRIAAALVPLALLTIGAATAPTGHPETPATATISR